MMRTTINKTTAATRRPLRRALLFQAHELHSESFSVLACAGGGPGGIKRERSVVGARRIQVLGSNNTWHGDDCNGNCGSRHVWQRKRTIVNGRPSTLEQVQHSRNDESSSSRSFSQVRQPQHKQESEVSVAGGANNDSQSQASESTTTTSAATPKMSFHRRTLPESCVALSSRRGKALFSSAHAHGGLKTFFPLMEQFVTQSEPAYCGVSTLVMALNALAVDPNLTWKGPWRWYEEHMLNCIDLDQAKEVGITLPTFVSLAKCQGLHTEPRMASDFTVDQLREAVKEACLEDIPDIATPDEHHTEHNNVNVCQGSHRILVATYNRGSLGQTGSGHFSPVAAYDSVSDYVLILDVARFKYGPHWISLEKLYEAMQPLDPDTQQSRGYIFLSFHEGGLLVPSANARAHQTQVMLPQSKLFESSSEEGDTSSTSSAVDAWGQFQELVLNKHNMIQGNTDDGKSGSGTTLELFRSVVQYWLKDGVQGETVWDVIRPQLIPEDDLIQKEYAQNVVHLLQQLTDCALSYHETADAFVADDADSSSTTTISGTSTSAPNTTTPTGSTVGAPVLMHHGQHCRRALHKRFAIRPLDAMFVIFLASLPTPDLRHMIALDMYHQVQQQQRQNHVSHTQQETGQVSRSSDDSKRTAPIHQFSCPMAVEQILMEAELVRLAMEYNPITTPATATTHSQL
jgi:glutathione gamma-glutamylcysteinyltransferase